MSGARAKAPAEPAQLGLIAGVATSAEHEAALKDLEDDPTARPLIRGILRDAIPGVLKIMEARDGWAHVVVGSGPEKAGLEVSEDWPLRLLDVCAGFGAWASEFAWFWVHALGLPRNWLHITAIEINPAKRAHLERWCDRSVIADVAAALSQDEDGWDIVIGNPHFSALTNDEPSQALAPLLLAHAPVVLLLHTLNCFVRGDPGQRCWVACKPAATWLVPGTASFRSHGKPASDCYTASVWVRGHEGPTDTDMISARMPINPHTGAPFSTWRWSKLPGTEDATEAKALGLPMAPGYIEGLQ